jgi:hypothetical protein
MGKLGFGFCLGFNERLMQMDFIQSAGMVDSKGAGSSFTYSVPVKFG